MELSKFKSLTKQFQAKEIFLLKNQQEKENIIIQNEEFIRNIKLDLFKKDKQC